MGEVISIALQKGGCGKTTTCINTAAILAEHKKKVLVIDFDGQGNASLGLGIIPEDYFGLSILEVLKGEKTFEDCIIHTNYGVDLVPANDFLSGLTITVIQDPDSFPDPMLLLKNKLDKIKGNYDYIFIDMPPELGFFTINGLTASDSIIIPLQCEPRASRGVSMLIDTIQNVRKAYNPDIKVRGILGTMFNKNTNISTTVLEQARKFFAETDIKVYDTTIYRTIKFSEADLYNTPAVAYSSNDSIQNYRNFVREAFEIG